MTIVGPECVRCSEKFGILKLVVGNLHYNNEIMIFMEVFGVSGFTLQPKSNGTNGSHEIPPQRSTA